MSRIVYFDCFAGASGDMILGALLDLGLPLPELQSDLDLLHLPGYRLNGEPCRRGPIVATRAIVEMEPGAPRRNLDDITALIDASGLPRPVKNQAVAIFDHLARAEAAVHGRPVSEIHFHEVGAVDAIVDVTGAVCGLKRLGIETVFCSALPAGAGFVKSSHGTLPVPAPATLQLIADSGATLTPPPSGVTHEMVTPTGAAILTALATFRQPEMRLERVGHGAGGRDLPRFPNVLRAWLGEINETPLARTLMLLETNLDDMNPEWLPFATERLLAEGARDVWLTPIIMKKGRPAYQLSVLCDTHKQGDLVDVLLRETTTLGVRARTVQRYEAFREQVQVSTRLGDASVKVRRDAQGVVTGLSPEYEDCRRLAEATGRPLPEVYRLVTEAGWAACR